MLKIKGLIQDKLILILKILFKVTLKTIYKNFRIFKIFLKQLFKFSSNNKIGQLILSFVLYLSIANYIF